MATKAKRTKKKPTLYADDGKGRITGVLLPVEQYVDLLEATGRHDDLRRLERVKAACAKRAECEPA
jgi:hypothetical protein